MRSSIIVIKLLAIICLFAGCDINETDKRIKNTIESIDLSGYSKQGINRSQLEAALEALRNLNANQLEHNPIIYYSCKLKRVNNEYYFCVFWIAKDSDSVNSIMLKNDKDDRLIIPISNFHMEMNKKQSEKFVLFVMSEEWDESSLPTILKSNACAVRLLKNGQIVTKTDFKVINLGLQENK